MKPGRFSDGKTHRLADLGLGAISIEGFIFKIVARVPLAAAVWLFGAAIGALAVRRPRKDNIIESVVYPNFIQVT